MDIESKKTERIDPEFDIFIAKRLPYALRSKYYNVEDMEKIAKDLFELGIEFATDWNNCYINVPRENGRVILKINENEYHICKYSNMTYTSCDGNHKVISIDPNSRWRYLDYPNCGCKSR